ncbi:uncharacterized protein LOC119190978 [Manduca sexta]|uniref:uncharacterized protein LOC119190978 n=1 Tax=Manduca sexta TaxID=7130 RepID=UPI0018900D1D|nr:uncharacterized protein LOC119190978 [Manduca sexta]
MYFKVNKVTDDLKLPTLIATMGDEAYELLAFAEEDTITFAEAVKLAQSLEAAERDAAIVESTNGAEAMHAMKQNTSSKGWARRGGSYSTPSMRTRAAGERAGSAGAGALAAEPSTSVRQYGEPRASVRQYGKCTACGRTSHSFTVCRFRNFICSKCHRVGHLRRVCPAENADSAQMSQECTYFGGAEAREFSDNEYDVIHNSSREEDGNIEEQLNLLALNNYKAI